MAAEPENRDKDVRLESVDDLCEFWEWALATRRRLESRVEELSDPDRPRRRAEELRENLREYAVRPLDESFEQDVLSDLLPYAHEETQKDLGTAKRELETFLLGPIAWSQTGELRFREGLCGLTKSRPRYGLRDAWEDRFLGVLVLDAVDGLHEYYETPEDVPLQGVSPESIPVWEEPTQRGLLRMKAVARLALLILRTGPVTEDRMKEASARAYELIHASASWEPGGRMRDWGKSRLRAIGVVGEVTGMTRDAVTKLYGTWRKRPSGSDTE
jgi:hypothetical protein